MGTPIDLSSTDVRSLLRLYAETIEALRGRGVIRSSNNPVCDYAEWLVSRSLGLTLVTKSQKGHDAVDSSGLRYQIKSRRITKHNASRQLGVFRNLDANPFDVAIAVLFDDGFALSVAYRMTLAAIKTHARFKQHVNGHILVLQGSILRDEGVEDITSLLAVAEAAERTATASSQSSVVSAVRAPVEQHRVPVLQEQPIGAARMTQRDKMRECARRYGLNAEAVIKAYAEAELRGEVQRARNSRDMHGEEYARLLWADGIKKGLIAGL